MSTVRYEPIIKLSDKQRRLIGCYLADEDKRKPWPEHKHSTHHQVYDWIHETIDNALEDIEDFYFG